MDTITHSLTQAGQSDRTVTDEVGWAMVGTLEHYNGLLKRITDSAFGEGEYAR